MPAIEHHSTKRPSYQSPVTVKSMPSMTPSYHHPSPQQSYVPPYVKAPELAYHRPEQMYHPNHNPVYHKPKPSYHEPKPAYKEPKPSYHDPKPAYHEPKPSYHKPKPDYHAPKPTYIEPKPAYHEPKPSHHETELKELHSEPLYYPGKDPSIAVIAVNHSNKNSNYSDSQKELGKVLEEFKNRSVLSLFQNGGKFELSGPYYVVTPAPLQSVSMHK